MTGSDRLRMKKPLKNHEAHSWKKKGEPFTDQTDGGGRGFTHKLLIVETQQPGQLHKILQVGCQFANAK